jgi:polyhydroxyalkanoate synthesis regulator phasin
MPIVQDSRYTQDAVAGAVNTGLFSRAQEPQASPSKLDVLAAAARSSTLAGAAYERVTNHDPDEPDAPANWDPLDHVQGFEDYASDLAHAQTPAELEGKKNRIRSQQQDREVLARAGFAGGATAFGFTLIDPSFLVSAGVPEIAIGRSVALGKTITAAARGAAGAAGYEAGMQQLQQSRSATESLFNIGSGALLSGVLGRLLHRVPSSESAKLRETVDAEAQELVRSESGAAAVARPTTLEQESIATGAKGLSKAMAKTPLVGTDLDKIMASESITARTALQDLADVPQILEKNTQGIATPNSVESAVFKHDARVADFMDLAREQWKAYRERVPADERISQEDFYTSIASASRRGDTVGIPEVDTAAKYLRSRVFDPLKDEAQRLGLFANAEGGEIKPVGAESYFRRMYDRDVIRANLAEWHQILASHFTAQGGAEPAEITAAVEDVTRKILHADVGQANFATKVTVPAAGPLKERTLDIPDERIEKFLINDPQRVARAYVRELAPQVELAKRFGDVDMKQQIQSITDEYNLKREAIRKQEGEAQEISKELKRLTDQEKDTLEALVRVRDRVLGRAGRLSPDAGEGARRAVMAMRGWRNIVASARLGGTALTGGLMDTAKIAAQYGFMPTMQKLTQLATSPAFRSLAKAQARRVGSAVEAALARRVQIAYDGAVTEGWTQTLANSVYKYTGLNHITDFNRTLAASLMENSVLKAAQKVSEGGALRAFERTRLASLGLGDDEMKAIAEQIAQHGGEVNGIRVSGSADWTDKRLADIYDAAILKESKIAVQQPGAADRVWWLDSETGKLLGQLKTFSLSSPTRLLAGGLQMAGQGEYARAARFFGFMMIGGYLTHALRQVVAGKMPTTDPQTAAFEAFTESGLGGVFPDVFSPVGRRLGMFGESVRYSDRNPMAAYGGPALGAMNDAYDFAFNRTAGGISASDLHMLRRMLPFNQVWWLRREINALEGELAEGLELKDADSATFVQRLERTDVMAPKKSVTLAARGD